MRIRIALADITPPPGVAPTVTGWAPDRPLPLDWQAERFRAKALLMERAGDPPLLLLTVDLLWVSDEMRTRVAAAAEAAEQLCARVEAFDDPARAYLAQPHPGLRPRFPEYAQLARVAEWDLGEDP